ncbi:MAG: pitrilysin family protein [Polyangiaceae bacterium]
MRRSRYFAAGPIAAMAVMLGSLLAPAEAHALDLPFKKSKLSNGLTVIVHEDHALPTVAVNVYYKVGSRDEQTKRTGFAHLFEHLMFMGTARAPEGQFDALMEAAGGSNNAWTSEDATDYHETGPATSLKLLLWLEADRLEALGKQIDQKKLDLQRDVVRNERRQTSENEPYGKADLRMPELLFPEGHPYHHPTIGSHEDLEAASVADVQAFFAKYYVPSNASLVVAGDVKSDEVVELAQKYFGHIPAGTAPTRRGVEAAPKLGKVIRETMKDKVELPKLIIAFHSPAQLEEGDAELDLLASVLSSGKASRLQKALMFDKSLARSVSVAQHSQEMSSIFEIEVIAQDGVTLDELEKAVDAVLTDAASRAPTESELKRARSEYELGFVSRLQGMAARAALLNAYEAKKGDPGFVDRDLARYKNATADGILSWAKKTLTLDSRVIVRVVPEGK